MIAPVEVPPIRSNQSDNRTRRPSISPSSCSNRSRNATAIAPRTPPPSSARIRFGPGPNKCRSRAVSTTVASDTLIGRLVTCDAISPKLCRGGLIIDRPCLSKARFRSNFVLGRPFLSDGRGSMADFDLFISHASVDHQPAMSIVTDLENKGIRCWIAPRNIPLGSAYQIEIVKALEYCRAILLVFSEAANKSEHILREVELAAQERKPIYPVRIDATIPSGGLRYLLANKQWVERQALGDRLVATIAQLLSADGLATPAAAAPSPVPAPETPPKPNRLPVYLGAGAAVVMAAAVAVWFAVRPGPPAPIHNDGSINPAPKDQPAQPKEPSSQPAATGADVIELMPPVASA